MPDTLLQIRDLTTHFTTESGVAKAVDGLDLDIYRGEVLGLVGESGSGKTVTALSILRLIPDPPGKIVRGSILFKNQNLLKLSWEEIRGIRGVEISMIFQEPMTSLNPTFTIGMQLSEIIRQHQKCSSKEAFQKSIQMLTLVGISDPELLMSHYPHQFSGGMRQRVMIAMALACRPKVLIADEPTTALDVTVQAQIFDLMRAVGKETDAAIILITHDMGSVAEMAERVVVMYAGRKIEEGYVDDILARPRHPYTRGLIACVPHLLETVSAERPSLQEIPGMVPPLSEFGFVGCLFAPRCDRVETRCWQEKPQVTQVTSTQGAACWNLEEAKISADA